jgi:hypothetical protein
MEVFGDDHDIHVDGDPGDHRDETLESVATVVSVLNHESPS